MSDYRNVWALIAAVGLLQLSGGILGVITPIGLEALGANTTVIGVIGALYAAGFMAGAWLAPGIIASIGNIRVFSAGAAVAAATSLSMGLLTDPVAWTLVRLVQGAAFAAMFASAESWLAIATPAPARGGVMGFYHVVAKAALLLGPFLVVSFAPLEITIFVWVGLFFALSLLPICLTRRTEPPNLGQRAMGPRALWKLAPAALSGAFLAGVINTGVLALLPLFAQEIEIGGTPTQAAALAMAAAWTGGMLSQWPAGRLSDRVDRRLVVAGMAVLSLLASIVLAMFSHSLPSTAVIVTLGIWGAGSLSFYGIAIAHGVDRAETEQNGALMAGLLFVWAVGSVIGPAAAGAAMIIGPGGLFLFSAVLTALLVVAMVWRREQRDAVMEEDRENWELTRPTSLVGAEFDPRIDPDIDATASDNSGP